MSVHERGQATLLTRTTRWGMAVLLVGCAVTFSGCYRDDPAVVGGDYLRAYLAGDTASVRRMLSTADRAFLEARDAGRDARGRLSRLRPNQSQLVDTAWQVESAGDTVRVAVAWRDTASSAPRAAGVDTLTVLAEREGMAVRYRVWLDLATATAVAPFLAAYESDDSSSAARARTANEIRVLFARLSRPVPPRLAARFAEQEAREAEIQRFVERLKADLAEIQAWDVAQFSRFGAHPAFQVFGWGNRRYQFGDDVRWYQARRAFDPAEGGRGVGYMELRVGNDQRPGVYCTTGLVRPRVWETGSFEVKCYEPDR